MSPATRKIIICAAAAVGGVAVITVIAGIAWAVVTLKKAATVVPLPVASANV
jgi:hypothetical protein